MKEIKLTGKYGTEATGKVCQVSDEDYEKLKDFKWYCWPAKNTYYAVRSIKIKGTRRSKQISIHRTILNIIDSVLQGDHIDGDGLNNQRENLRAVTRNQNNLNKSKQKGCTSNYIGVRTKYNKHSLKYEVYCRSNKIERYKYMDNEIEAALQYNEWAKEMHGEYAKLNIIPPNGKIN